MTQPRNLSDRRREHLGEFIAACPGMAALARPGHNFAQLMGERRGGDLDAWIADVRKAWLPAVLVVLRQPVAHYMVKPGEHRHRRRSRPARARRRRRRPRSQRGRADGPEPEEPTTNTGHKRSSKGRSPDGPGQRQPGSGGRCPDGHRDRSRDLSTAPEGGIHAERGGNWYENNPPRKNGRWTA